MLIDMKLKTLLPLLLLSLMGSVNVVAQTATSLLLPKPHELTENGASFNLSQTVSITDATGSTLLASLFPNQSASAAATVSVNIVDASTLGTFDYTLAGFPNEGYRLEVTSNAITIRAATATGVIRAAQTLMQLAQAGGGTAIPGVSITDYPAFKLRGYMHDVGRSFVSFDELKHEVDLLSRFKVNVFHWHLTDNQGFRFESKAYPQLNASSAMTRFAGSYYTQAQCTELEAYAAERGMIIIPEIDMPGHSQAFQTAMGFAMNSEQGKPVLKALLDELAAAFPLAPYLHIGCDEAGTTAAFVNEMSQYVKETLGRKCLVWNPISGVTISKANLPYIDMTEMWGTAGRKIGGLPNIDCRYNYINHFDVFADLVGIYKSNIYYQSQGSAEVAGAISGLWNDRKTPTETDIIRQNNLWANAIATAERGWIGGGQQYIEVGGTTLPNSGSEFEEFADWERRFLYYKGTWLQDESIPYVRQTNIKWRITQAFPNGGTAGTVFPPEESTADVLPDEYTYDGQTYATSMATGGAIYLRHVWGTTVPAFFSNPQLNTTAYAWTYVYSPVAQTAGALIEFQNYSRSENDKAPDAGKWDRKGSRIWVNGTEVAPPTWANSGKSISSEVDLQNENFTARAPMPINLQAGWNKIFIKLPYVSASNIRLNKWMFTFVLTDTEGRNALEGITYSPIQSLDSNIDGVVTTIGDIKTYVNSKCGTAVGLYPVSAAATLMDAVATVEATLQQTLSAAEREAQVSTLTAAFETFKSSLASAAVNQPLASTATEDHYYTLCTPLRGTRYVTSSGAGAELGGHPTPAVASYWKFVSRADGTWDIVNAVDASYIAPNSTNNSALSTSATQPSAGWTIGKASTEGYVIITSGSCQFNQTNNSSSVLTGGYRLYNWGGGANTTDTGCQYLVTEVDAPDIFLPKVTEVYTLNNTNSRRGALVYDGTSANVGLVASGSLNAGNQNHQWVFCPTATAGEYYLYNVGAGKFAIPTAIAQSNQNVWVFSDNAVAVTLTSETDGTYRIKMAKDPVSGNNQAVIGVNNGISPQVFNYNDAGSDFTITRVEGADASTAVTAAVSKLVSSQTAISDYPQASGWYAIQIKQKTGAASYAGRFVKQTATPYNDLYPLTFTGDICVQPAITDASFFVHIDHTAWNDNRVQLPDGRYLTKNDGGKFPVAATASQALAIGIGTYIKTTDNTYAEPNNNNANYYISENGGYRADYIFYPIDLDAAGLTAWQVTITNGAASTQLTCTRDDVKGLASVFSGGYIFLPTGVTPAAADFTMPGIFGTPVVDAENHVITAQHDPTVALVTDGVTVRQGWQTAGRGSEVMLLSVTAAPFKDATDVTMTVSLKDGAEEQLSALTLYEASTSSPEILSAGNAGAPTKTQVATTGVDAATATLTIGNLESGTHYYWLAATVKNDAALGAIVDAAVTGIAYTCAGQQTQLDLTSVGDPADRGAMVFNVHSYPYLPRDNGSRVYRIPAMVVADDGSIVVACDKRYDSYTDIGGGHVIDIVVRRSTDGGRTWSAPLTIAKGLGTADNDKCGYGDPSLVKGKDGKIYCLFVAGNIGYFYGQKHIAMSTSTDNGVTWSSGEGTPPTDLFSTGAIQNWNTVGAAGYGLYDYFVTSGRGLYIPDDDILMYLIPAQTMTSATEHTGNSQDYIFYSTDGGVKWYFSPTAMFDGGDEAKIIQRNDGSLLGSVRQGGNRGFCSVTYTKNDDGTLTFNKHSQWNNAQLNAGGYANNQDIFYYSRSSEGEHDIIFHTMTTGQHANFNLYMSIDGGSNWTQVMQLQSKGTRYVTMDKLANGDLAFLFEDQSLNAAGGYTDYNHYPINFLTITKEQVDAMYDHLVTTQYVASVVVKNSVYGTSTGCDSYGSLSGSASGRWARTWTSNASSGVAGLTVSTESGYGFDKATLQGTRVMTLRPSAAGATDTYTITAPAGYLISGYTVGGIVYQSGTYRITAADGTTTGNITSTTTPKKMTVSDVNASSTTFTFYGASQSNWFAFTDFTITLTTAQEVPLIIVGDASYSTLYLPYAISLPENTKAYAVSSVAGTKATLTEIAEAVPDATPVVLVNSDAAPSVICLRTDKATPYSGTNYLRGTFYDIQLDLAEDNGLYSLGRLDDKIGFYKFENNGTTTITLGANKAYLDTTTPAGVKGFTLGFGGDDGIGQLLNGKSATGTWYDLNGRRLSGEPAAKGVYFTGGKKVVVK